MQNDAFSQVPANVSTVFDLLDEKGISWGVYQENLPFSGFEGFAWPDQKTGANNCEFEYRVVCLELLTQLDVRKHNPAIIYNSVAQDGNRLAKIKNTTLFFTDLAQNKLPQWVS